MTKPVSLSKCIGSDQNGTGDGSKFWDTAQTKRISGLAPQGQPTAGRQHALLDGVALAQNVLGSSKVNIGWGVVGTGLVVTLLVVIPNEGGDRFFQIARESVQLQLIHILHRQVIALNPALVFWASVLP